MNTSYEEMDSVAETITFHCPTTRAATVCLIGDFNNWSASANPMNRMEDGSWFLQVPLSRGRHYYQFLVDGEPVLDPEAMCEVRQDRRSRVSLIALC